MTAATTSETRPKRSVNLANIPAFPAVVLRVLDIVSQDDPDLRSLVQEINSDATLSAQVLRLANSPLFGFSAQISTVQHAVVALGTAQIQSLVMSVATANYSRAAFRSEALRKCWRHTLASAILCREVARAAGMAPEQAYSLGLLHDIGRLGLLVAWPDDYSRILEDANRDGVSCWNWNGSYLIWIIARSANSSWNSGNFRRNSARWRAIITIRRRIRENRIICALLIWAARWRIRSDTGLPDRSHRDHWKNC